MKGGQDRAQGPKASPPSNTLLDFELFLPVGLREAPHEHIIMSSIPELPKFREAWALGHARGPGNSDYANMPQVDPSELHVPPFIRGSVSDSSRSPGCHRSRLLTEFSQSSGWIGLKGWVGLMGRETKAQTRGPQALLSPSAK